MLKNPLQDGWTLDWSRLKLQSRHTNELHNEEDNGSNILSMHSLSQMFYYNDPVWWQVGWYGVGVEANLSVAIAKHDK